MPSSHANSRVTPPGPSSTGSAVAETGRFRMARWLPKLAGGDLEFLRRLFSRKQPFQAQDELRAEGDSGSTVYLIEEGWAYRYELLSDGRRQILNLALPGDFVGLRSGLFGIAEHTTIALTPGVAARIPGSEIADLFRTHPRIAAALAWSSAQEEAMLADRVVSLGRRNAFERVAHFLLELSCRLRAAGLAAESSFPLVLTQELLGDILGLSVVHINRTLRRLREENLVTVEHGRVTLHQPETLAEISDFHSDYLSVRDDVGGGWPVRVEDTRPALRAVNGGTARPAGSFGAVGL